MRRENDFTMLIRYYGDAFPVLSSKRVKYYYREEFGRLLRLRRKTGLSAPSPRPLEGSAGFPLQSLAQSGSPKINPPQNSAWRLFTLKTV
jgi:hypothetical protein